jgi:AraC-like DNA-binding protein
VRKTAEVDDGFDRIVFGTLGIAVIGLDDKGGSSTANDSWAWLDFVRECHATVQRHERGAAEPHETKALVAAATRLETRTARVLALSMLTRVAGRLAGTSAPPGARTHTDVTGLDSRAAFVLSYIGEHHSNSSCRLEEIAATLRVSRSYLSRLVIRKTGATFIRHLQLARMNTAARLLHSTHLSVKEVSSATGYEHVPSFDRQFRRHFRMTPGEFRRGIRI